ncbi:hypothetical protein [Gluconobacter kondonii]|uniref:hypothetical protein n=1 Tax=Gluconobacter kondonii TaxID=941463 RepID=UPI00197E0F34|nr:hypothetical protein [Gluconobacter kondonii]MBN3866429.1 hypothetical protein [Gluconobacter kondonii]
MIKASYRKFLRAIGLERKRGPIVGLDAGLSTLEQQTVLHAADGRKGFAAAPQGRGEESKAEAMRLGIALAKAEQEQFEEAVRYALRAIGACAPYVHGAEALNRKRVVDLINFMMSDLAQIARSTPAIETTEWVLGSDRPYFRPIGKKSAQRDA